jgi:hypothetical protein
MYMCEVPNCHSSLVVREYKYIHVSKYIVSKEARERSILGTLYVVFLGWRIKHVYIIFIMHICVCL